MSDALLEATLGALGARPAVETPRFLAELRTAARAWLEARGLPGPREEAFRFTPLREVLGAPCQLASEQAGTHDEPDTVVVVDGAPRLGPAGSKHRVVTTLSAVLASEPSLVEPWLGRVVPPTEGFVAQNTALFQDAVVVVARAGADSGTLHVRYQAGEAEGAILSLPRLLVQVEAGGKLLLVETHRPGPEGRLDNAVTEIVLEEGAHLEHIRIVEGSGKSRLLSSVGVRAESRSRYSSRVFTFGGPLSRLDLAVRLAGEGAECNLDGLYVAGQGQRVDHHTLVEHRAPRCTSREQYKGILDGDGLSVFDGTVVVRRGASGTVAHQESRNLLLSNDAVAHAKPHLEIDTDDVKCSHGATVGRLDPAQLFYLRSRGLGADVARAVLTLAFGREVIQRVPDAALRERLDHTLSALLPGGTSALEVL